MLDPLSSLSLASSVVQFIDFSCKLLSDGLELYATGALEKNDGLEQITKNLARVTEGLTGKNIPPEEPRSGDELALEELAGSCKVLADQLLDILLGLRPKKPHNGLDSFRKALRAVKQKGKIEGIEDRLNKLQNQLCLCLNSILK